ncbi:MAG: hypothetical protein JSS58_10775 [Proteobacteria bacterium]|nr:hypothetical protein [Pseudomonadota bacterium]
MRLWLLGAALWGLYAAGKYQAVDEIGYAYRYRFHYETLTTKDAAQESCGWSEAVDRVLGGAKTSTSDKKEFSPYLQRFLPKGVKEIEDCVGQQTALGKPRPDAEISCGDEYEQKHVAEARQRAYEAKKARENECFAAYRPRPPSWEWVAWVFLPPTLGVALIAAATWVFFVTARWLVKGFIS